MKKIGKEAKFLEALSKGRTITRRQAMVQFKLGNPSATVLRLDEAGIYVDRQYVTVKKVINGRKFPITTVRYSL